VARVLVVGDDVDLLWDLAAVRPAGVELLTATGAAAATAMLGRLRVDVVVLDLRAPGSVASAAADEGLALLGSITGAYRGRVPVVVTTDSEDPELAMWCGRLGAGRVVSRSDGLRALIQAALDLVGESSAHAAGSHAETASGDRARGDACGVSAARRSGGPGTARGSSCALRTAGDRGAPLSA